MTKLRYNGFFVVIVRRLVFQFVCYALIVRGQAISQIDQRHELFDENHDGWHWPSIFEWPFQTAKSYKNIDSRDEEYGISKSKPSVQYPTQFFLNDKKPVNDLARLEPIDEIENFIGELETMSARVTRSATCTAEGFFHVENDCKRFYRCVRNDGVGGKTFTKFEFSCGEGTIWDPVTTACNHPWAVQRPDCKNSINGDNGYNEGDPDLNGNGEVDTSQNGNNNNPVQEASQNSGSEQQPQESYPGIPQSSTSGSVNLSTLDPQNGNVNQPNGYEDLGTTPTSQNNVENNGKQSCTADGFYPVAKNCKKFIRCVSNGQGGYTEYEFDCAEGTVWDVDTTTCNFPYAVNRRDCNSDSNSSAQTTNDENLVETPTTKATPASYGQISSQYPTMVTTDRVTYGNNNGTGNNTTTIDRRTPSTTPNQLSSTSSANQQQTSTTVSSQQGINRPSGDNSQTNDLQNSTTNANNQLVTSTRPSSPNNDQPTNATTNGQDTNSVTTATAAGINQQGQDVCTSEGFFPSSKSCQKFYRCVNFGGVGYTKYEFNCGPGTVWDPDLNTCNHPWAVNSERCQSESVDDGSGGAETSSATSSSDVPFYSTSSMSPANQSKPSSSESPYSTTPTTSSPYSTTPTTSSPYSTTPTTSSPQNNTNNDKTTINVASTTTAKPSSSTRPSNINQTTPTVTSVKPSGNANTTDSVGHKPETCKNMTAPPKRVDRIKCEKAGYYPHPQSCKKFYRCVDWDGDKGKRFSVFHFDCPAGTIFDPSLNICNHENSVYPPRDCANDEANATATASGTDVDSNQSSCVPPTNETSTASSTEKPAETITDSVNNNRTTTDASTETATESTTVATSTVVTTNVPSTETVTDSVQTTMTMITTTDATTITESTVSSIGSTPTTIVDEMTTTTLSFSTTPTSTITSTTTDDENTSTITSPPTTPSQTEITTTIASTTIATELSDKCPKDIDDNQFVLVCPTGFRRHPKYCDVFYQCTTSDTKPGEIKVLTLSCANGTIYDADKVQCLPPDQTSKCDAKMMASNSGKNVKQMPTIGNLTSILPVAPSSKSFCPSQGSFAYADDCSLFYKCTSNQGGKLNAYLYQCPEGYVYYNVRCEKMNKVPCEGGKRLSSVLKSALTAAAPVEMKNIGH